MCGIAGYVTRPSHEKPARIIHDMLKQLERRGPDGTSWLGVGENQQAFWQRKESFDSEQRFHLAVGCSRLAIQDLSEDGLQPIRSQSGQAWVTLNGEVFNFLELRQQLQQQGYRFVTGTDTEVVAAAYEHFGTECFSKFNGQFSIAIYDVVQKKLFLARDRIGITPLYILKNDNFLAFGSEVKAVWEAREGSMRINAGQVAAIVGLPYKLHWKLGSSLFQDISTVYPGHFVSIDLNNLNMKEHSYWDIRNTDAPNYKCFLEAKEHVQSLLVDSVKIRMRADREIAFIVSGGIDSSSILGIANKEFNLNAKTFSLNISSERFNEKPEIEEVLDFNGVAHNFIDVTEQKVIELFPEVVASSDEPLATPNAILHGIMSRAINAAGICVVLNGVGGDEAFLGYHDHFLFSLSEAHQGDPKRFIREYPAWLRNQKRSPEVFSDFEVFLASQTPGFSPDFLARSRGFDYRTILNPQYDHLLAEWSFKITDPSPTGKQIDDLTRLTIPHSIRMDDNCYLSMSIEARQPFLDHRLIEAGVYMNTVYKARNSVSKFVLRQAVKRYIPVSRRLDQRKIGLNFPIDDWFRSGLKPWIKSQLDNSGSPLYEFAEYKSVQEILDQHDRNEANHCLKIWDLLSLNNWLLRYT